MGKQEAEEAKSKGYEPYSNPHRRRVDVTMNGQTCSYSHRGLE